LPLEGDPGVPIQRRLQAVKKVRVYEEIVAQITSLILNGELKVGDRLPSERELCETFGVGRNSVREATRALESAHLVETRQGEGTYVTASADSLVPVLSARISSGGESGIRYLFEARRVLEPQVAALAAERATRGEVHELEAVIERQRAEMEGGGTGMAEDTAFHLGLARAAKNEFLERLVGILLNSLTELRERSIRKKADQLRSLGGHEKIIEAIRSGDEKGAVVTMISHLLEIEGREMGYPEPEEEAEEEEQEARRNH